MHKGLIRVLRPHGWRGKSRPKWVRAPGIRSPSRTKAKLRAKFEEVRLRALYAIGVCCKKCNFFDERALQIDHIRGGGNKERSKYSGIAFYYYVLRNPDKRKYQVLCANCNVIKRRERSECVKG